MFFTMYFVWYCYLLVYNREIHFIVEHKLGGIPTSLCSTKLVRSICVFANRQILRNTKDWPALVIEPESTIFAYAAIAPPK